MTQEMSPGKIRTRVAEGLRREDICQNLEAEEMLDETQADLSDEQLNVEDLTAQLEANGQHLQLLAAYDVQIELELGQIRRRQARLEFDAVRNKAEVDETVRRRADLSKKLKSATDGLQELQRKENLLKAQLDTPTAPRPLLQSDPSDFWSESDSATPTTRRHRWGSTLKLPKIFSKSLEKVTRL